MTFIITTVAGMTAIVSGALFSYGHSNSGITVLLLSLSLSLWAITIRLNLRKNPEERKILLNACLEIIDLRTRLTVENVGEFRSVFKQYRYSLTREQKRFVGSLLSAIGDTRINNEELTGLGDCEERNNLIASNRSLLNKIEKSRLVIESFLNQT